VLSNLYAVLYVLARIFGWNLPSFTAHWFLVRIESDIIAREDRKSRADPD